MTQADISAVIDYEGMVTLERTLDGGVIQAPAEVVVKAINEQWPGKWAEYAACWQANGWFVESTVPITEGEGESL
jgi:hypothetical protein